MSTRDKIRRMAEKKQWDRLSEQFRGTDEERSIAACVCGASEDKDAYNLLVSEINSSSDDNEKIFLIKALGNTKRGEAAVYLSWLAATGQNEAVTGAIDETLSVLRTRFR